MLHRIIQRPLNTAFDKLYARRAAKFPINPDGVLRVRHPALILISVFISALVGTRLDMESLGKNRTADGRPVPHTTGGIVFGEEGVNCQHAYFQLPQLSEFERTLTQFARLW